MPDRQQGEGPFERLILGGITIVNSEGAPPAGPMGVMIEGNRIAGIRKLGADNQPECVGVCEVHDQGRYCV